MARTGLQTARFRLQIASLIMYSVGLVASIVAVVANSKHINAGSVVSAVLLMVVLLSLVVFALAWLGRRITRKRRSVYSVGERDWMSPLGYFLGPYDGEAGLEGSREFFDRHSRHGKQPQGYLITTNYHLAIAAADRPFQVLVRPYIEIDRVDLFPGARERKKVVTPGSAHFRGQILISTKDGRKAGFSGTTVHAFSTRLTNLGASIVPADGSNPTSH